MASETATLDDVGRPDGTPDASANRRPSPRTRMTFVLALPTAFLMATAIARYLNGHAGIDLAVYDQGIWAFSRGESPWVSIVQEGLLEDHFGPAILAFALLYRLAASPVWLLVGQAVAAGVSARLIAERLSDRLGYPRAGLVGASLILSPPVAYALLFDVHSVVFAVPFALGAAFALEDNRPRRAVALGLLAALFRVEVGLAVVALFAFMPGERKRRLGPALLLSAYVFAAMYMERYLGHDGYWASHFSHLGESPVAALSDPLRLASTLVSVRTLAIVLPWLVSGAFLALKKPRLMVPAALLALPLFLSSWPGTAQIFFHYGYAPTLLLAVAWIPGLRSRPDRANVLVAGNVLLAVVFGVLVAIGIRDARDRDVATAWSYNRETRCLVSGIPANAGVSADIDHLSLLAHREHAYLWPYPFGPARDNVLPAPHMQRPNPDAARHVDYIILPGSMRHTVGPSFVDDGEGPFYVRLRRIASTEPGPVSCHGS